MFHGYLTYFSCFFTYSMVQDILWKADSHSACQKIACFLYGTRRFIAVFTKFRHWTLSCASRIQFAPSTRVSQRSILMLSSHLRLVFQVVSSLRVSQPKPRKHPSPPLPHACHMSCPPHSPWFNHPNNIRWRIKVMKFFIMQSSIWSIFMSFRCKYPRQHSSQTPSKLKTKFCTHTIQLAKLQFCTF
jgi:hypothetical protein